MIEPTPGMADILAPGLTRVLAPNPGPMTHWGTNTYLYGTDTLAVIDPGPPGEPHLNAILRAAGDRPITHILVTHAHLDHSPLAAKLAQMTGAPIYGFGRATDGRSPVMQTLAEQGMAGGGEGVDHAFQPDKTLSDGDVITGDGWHLDVLHTPGHFAGHLAFGTDGWWMSGDHVMDWASSLVSPPDGDLTDFMHTSHRLRALAPKRLFPGHGNPIEDPAARLDWLIDHRLTREAGILDALSSDPQSLRQITRRVYTDTDPAMQPAAERNVFAHLVDLVGRNRAKATPELSPDARFIRL